MKIIRSLFVCVILVGLASCDAPHLNPLDPGNPDFKFGQIDGYVKTQTTPQQAIQNVVVYWKNDNVSTLTDINGYYKINNVNLTNGYLYFDKYGYSKDSVLVNWGNQKIIHLASKPLIATIGELDGYVKTQTTPQQAIQNVKIFWKNENISTLTDINGYYKINNVNLTNGYLYFDKDGYSKDSLLVNWGGENNVNIGIKSLNAIPQLNSILIYTGIENRYQTDQNDTLYVRANISDIENDIDSVNVRSTSLNFNKKLIFNTKKNLYELTYFYGTKNSIPPIDDAIGKSFEIIVKDRFGKTFNIGSSTVKRVIRQEILFESPANGVIVGAKPVFRWNRFLPGFNFKYMVQVFTEENTQQLKWEKSNISKDDIEVIPDINFTAGDYYWVIWCIDDFQNRTRSKPATFTVQ